MIYSQTAMYKIALADEREKVAQEISSTNRVLILKIPECEIQDFEPSLDILLSFIAERINWTFSINQREDAISCKLGLGLIRCAHKGNTHSRKGE
jgi:hypothetical protein